MFRDEPASRSGDTASNDSATTTILWVGGVAFGVFGGARTPEEQSGPELLNHIAESTGGRLWDALPADLPDIARKIGIDLRNRYVLGYSPNGQAHDGKYHKVEVKIVPPRGLPKLQPHWRTGYYAPAE